MPTFASPHPSLKIPNLSLPAFIASRPPSDPEAPLFQSPDSSIQSLSFSGTLRLAEQISNGLRKLNWWTSSPTRCVAIYAPNHPAYIAVCLGVHLAGGFVTTANPAYGSHELEHQLEDAGAEMIVALKASEEQAAGALAKARQSTGKTSLVEKLKAVALGGLSQPTTTDRIYVFDAEAENSIFNLGKDEQAAHSRTPPNQETDWTQELAFLCYSSGTSGTPKGVRLSHHNLIANVLQNEAMLGESFGKGEMHIDVLPQFHCYGLVMSFMALVTGTPRKLFAKFDLEKYLKTIQEDKVTFGFVAPPMLLGLIKSPLTEKYDISSLKRVASGAAPLSEGLRKNAKERLGFIVTDGYGMTEMSPVMAVQGPKDIEPAPLSIGHLAPDVELRIVDDDGKELDVDETGELLVRGPNRMLGYHHNDEANAAAFTEDGFFRTGDVGHIDKSGYVFITDRKKDLIKFNGYQVSVAELESILISHASVHDAAVVPLYSEEKATELPFAYLVAAAGIDKTDEEIKRVVNDVNGKVAFFKKLRGGAEWIDEIPKNPSGKILHRQLREKLKEREKATQ